MSTVAWFHCFAGISGDMALGACLDAGASLEEVKAILERLPVRGWAIDAEPVLRGGLASTRAVVRTEEHKVSRTYAHIAGLLEEARLPPRVRERSGQVFRMLAEAEGRLHRRPMSQVHFHEVGSLDAIVDVVGTVLALHLLDVRWSELRCSGLPTGSGWTGGGSEEGHGRLPVPAPATLELLRLAGAPLRPPPAAAAAGTSLGRSVTAQVFGWGRLVRITRYSECSRSRKTASPAAK
jgi:uncharacterized protein (DUF111 family)